MSRRTPCPAPHASSTEAAQLKALKRTDRAVLIHLSRLQSASGGESCTAGLPGISAGAGVSQRQAQISANRLIEAGYLRRVGYDLGNPVRALRGTIYEVLFTGACDDHQPPHAWLREAVGRVLTNQADASALLEKIATTQGETDGHITGLVISQGRVQSDLKELLECVRRLKKMTACCCHKHPT